MTEPCFNIRQDVFGTLGRIGKGPLDVWFLLLRILPDGCGPVRLPRKLWADARSLVTAGIVLETETGAFTVNPDVVFLTEEPTLDELRARP